MADLNPRTLFAHLDEYATQTPLASLQHVVHAEERRLTRRLEAVTMLRPAHGRLGRRRTEVTMDLPPEARRVLESASDAVLFRVGRRAELLAGARVARAAAAHGGQLDAAQAQTLASAAELMAGMRTDAASRALFDALFGLDAPALATWDPRREQVRLHVIPCWLTANWCTVSVEAVGLLALLEALARGIVQNGVDSNGHRWLRAAYETAHPMVVHGVADYLVDLVLESLHDDPLREQARFVRDMVIESRPLARQWWRTWGNNGRKHPEDVRTALLAVRSEHSDAVPMREHRRGPGRVRVRHEAGHPRIEMWDDDGVEDMQHLLPEVLGLQRGHGLDRFGEHLGVSTDATIVRQLLPRHGADAANPDAPGAPQ